MSAENKPAAGGHQPGSRQHPSLGQRANHGRPADHTDPRSGLLTAAELALFEDAERLKIWSDELIHRSQVAARPTTYPRSRSRGNRSAAGAAEGAAPAEDAAAAGGTAAVPAPADPAAPDERPAGEQPGGR